MKLHLLSSSAAITPWNGEVTYEPPFSHIVAVTGDYNSQELDEWVDENVTGKFEQYATELGALHCVG